MQYIRAQHSDLDELVQLRIKAMRPSLEKVGRFDIKRAKARLADNFDPISTYKILKNNNLLGFYVLLNNDDCFWLDHFYIDNDYQGLGIGESVLDHIKEVVKEQSKPLRLTALKQSRANEFYVKQGFVVIEQQPWDNLYQYNLHN
ncbi:GNAT family N-acetyltransferase [Gammaproteobacteria bacterium AS21]|jgi:GNAT superfamily N-acetyltransferase